METWAMNKANLLKVREQVKKYYHMLPCRILNQILTRKEQYIMTKRLGLSKEKPISLEVLAKEFNITSTRIRHIELNAYSKMLKHGAQTIPVVRIGNEYRLAGELV